MFYKYVFLTLFIAAVSACGTAPKQNDQSLEASPKVDFVDNTPLFPEIEPEIPETIGVFESLNIPNALVSEGDHLNLPTNTSLTLSPNQTPSQNELDFGRGTTGLALIALGLKPTIYFELDSESLDEISINELRFHVDFLRDNPDVIISLEGHSDEQGSREYNLSLGFRRALTVQKFLQASSLKNTIETSSYGEERPALEGHSESVYKLNRRVEIYYREP